MPPAGPPILQVIAGPNGAGKTTFYQTQIRHLTDAEFVNADLLALNHFGHVATTQEESVLGQRMAEERRRALMADAKSLVTETTFSHASKLDLLFDARKAGYRLIVYHLNVRGPDYSVARVAARVEDGGHPVPERKIRERYARNQPLIRQAVLTADRAYILDNSRLGEPPRHLISFVNGAARQITDDLPDWTTKLYGGDLP